MHKIHGLFIFSSQMLFHFDLFSQKVYLEFINDLFEKYFADYIAFSTMIFPISHGFFGFASSFA